VLPAEYGLTCGLRDDRRSPDEVGCGPPSLVDKKTLPADRLACALTEGGNQPRRNRTTSHGAVDIAFCYPIAFMDDIIKHIIETGGDTALKSAIGSALTGMAIGLRKVLSRKDKKAIDKVAEKMVQVATLEDIERYDPKVETIRVTTAIHTGKHRAAPKKAAPKRANPAKKVVKKVASKKAVVQKKAAPKKAVRVVR